MHLSSVEIRNYRSLKYLQLKLQPGLNVFVGRNNTGKTNLLHAIRHALGPSASRGDALWLERDDFYRSSPTAEPETMMSVTLKFTNLSEGQRAHFYEIVDFDLLNLSNSQAIVRFEASWPNGKRQASVKRTGGSESVEPTEVPAKILESLPVTFLPALRDAEAALAPGYRSRLAILLKEMATRAGEGSEEEIIKIFSTANLALEDHKLINDIAMSLQATTEKIAGTDHVPSTISAAEAEFEKILRTLQVQMKGMPVGSLSNNGLGFNNILYIAVVLEHLKHEAEDECSILLVEEPEAHLHPQLTMLLAEHLATHTPGSSNPQTLVTTHSPTLAASVTPNRILVLCSDPVNQLPCCNGISGAGMDDKEQAELQRMMDVTRATLYFAKGALLVEGISEALLIPSLARRLGYDLAKEHISVIPICGVAFETFKKLLDPCILGIPVAIITDADPPVARKPSWDQEEPDCDNGIFKVSDRTRNLLTLFANHRTVRVHHSKVTLEYDLAEAGDMNAIIMADVWEGCFKGSPTTFNSNRVTAVGNDNAAKAMAAWRGICRANPTVGKAEFAHRLSAKLVGEDGSKCSPFGFVTPAYIKDAIEYVINAIKPQTP